MKVKLFYSIVTTLIVLFSGTLYLSSCQKDNFNATSQAQSPLETTIDAVDREDPPPVECPNCMGTIRLDCYNIQIGPVYAFDATIQTRQCIIAPWTTVKKYKINPFTSTITEPFQLSQDHYYRMILTNKSQQSATFASNILIPAPHNTTTVWLALPGIVPPNQTVVADYYNTSTDYLGRANCGCTLPIGCQ